MAPNGTRGRLSSYYNSKGTENKCADINAFGFEFNRIRLGFLAFFFLFNCIILIATLIKFTRSVRKRYAFRRWAGALIVTGIGSLGSIGVDIIISTLYECNAMATSRYHRLTLLVGWLNVVGLLAMAGVVIVSICRTMHEQANLSPKFVTITHFCFMLLLSIAAFLEISLYTATLASINPDGYMVMGHQQLPLMRPSHVMGALYIVLLFVGFLLAAIHMILAITRSIHLRKGALKYNVLFLVLTSITWAIVLMVQQFHWTIPDRPITTRAAEAMSFVTPFLRCTVYLFALLVASAPELSSQVTPMGVVKMVVGGPKEYKQFQYHQT